MSELSGPVQADQRTPRFSARSVAEFYTLEHWTKAGAWALLQKEQGRLCSVICAPQEASRQTLREGRSTVITPEQTRSVVLKIEETALPVECYRGESKNA